MTTDFKNSIIEAYAEVINDDFKLFISSIVSKFSQVNVGNLKIKLFDEKDLSPYSLEKIIIVETPIKIKKKRKKHSIPLSDNRCMARTWGGAESVKFIDGNWMCGLQCKRNKLKDIDYCGIHNKQIIKNKCLTHGRIDEEVPHDHYDKYKVI